MTFEEQKELVDKLLHCSTMGNRHTRDKIVNDLPFEFQHRIPRSDTDSDDVMSIVKRVLDFPDGPSQLVQAIRSREGNSGPMQAVDQWLAARGWLDRLEAPTLDFDPENCDGIIDALCAMDSAALATASLDYIFYSYAPETIQGWIQNHLAQHPLAVQLLLWNAAPAPPTDEEMLAAFQAQENPDDSYHTVLVLLNQQAHLLFAVWVALADKGAEWQISQLLSLQQLRFQWRYLDSTLQIEYLELLRQLTASRYHAYGNLQKIFRHLDSPLSDRLNRRAISSDFTLLTQLGAVPAESAPALRYYERLVKILEEEISAGDSRPDIQEARNSAENYWGQLRADIAQGKPPEEWRMPPANLTPFVLLPASGETVDDPQDMVEQVQLPFVGRVQELATLDDWLMDIEISQRGFIGVIHGRGGMGKQTLVREWISRLWQREHPPIIAQTTFLSPWLPSTKQAYAYRTETLATESFLPSATLPDIADYLPESFMMGSYPWLALAQQLVAQSPKLRDQLDRHNPLGKETQAVPLESLKELLIYTAQEERPLVIVLEEIHLSSFAWFAMVTAWEQEIRRSGIPCLLLLTLDYDQALAGRATETYADAWVGWLNNITRPSHSHGSSLYLTSLSWQETTALFTPESAQAADLFHYLSEGSPSLLAQLLADRQKRAQATPLPDGRWSVDSAWAKQTSQEYFDELYVRQLAHFADQAADGGYLVAGHEVTADMLLKWLRYAVWEGDTFTDQALAHVLGYHDDGPTLEEFQIVLDELLCALDEDGETGEDALLTEVGDVHLPTGDLAQPYRTLTQYGFVRPVVAATLRQRQERTERQRRGHAYAQSLQAIYGPYQPQIIPLLADLYQAIDLPEQAAFHRRRHEQRQHLRRLERSIQQVQATASPDRAQRRTLLGLLLTYAADAFRYRSPLQLIPYLLEATTLAQTLHDQREAKAWVRLAELYVSISRWVDSQQAIDNARHQPLGDWLGAFADRIEGQIKVQQCDFIQAAILYKRALVYHEGVHNIKSQSTTHYQLGRLYREQGEVETALDHFNQALVFYTQLDDARARGIVHHDLGILYRKQGALEPALDHFNQALALYTQADNIHIQGMTHQELGILYRKQGEGKTALNHLKLALVLSTEADCTGCQLTAHHDLGRLYREQAEMELALDHLLQALALAETAATIQEQAVIHAGLAKVYGALGQDEKATYHAAYGTAD